MTGSRNYAVLYYLFFLCYLTFISFQYYNLIRYNPIIIIFVEADCKLDWRGFGYSSDIGPCGHNSAHIHMTVC